MMNKESPCIASTSHTLAEYMQDCSTTTTTQFLHYSYSTHITFAHKYNTRVLLCEHRLSFQMSSSMRLGQVRTVIERNNLVWVDTGLGIVPVFDMIHVDCVSNSRQLIQLTQIFQDIRIFRNLPQITLEVP